MTNVLQQGVEAHQRGELDEARRLYEQTVAVATHNLAVLRDQAGEHAAGRELYREALAIDPSRDESAYALALSLLREGRYAEAWPLHERRRGLARLGLPKIPPHWPEWRGEPLNGVRLAVLGEQGFGDHIQFARFLPLLERQGAQVRLVCREELAPLLGGGPRLERRDFDAWCYLMSLPLRLQTTLETLPPPIDLRIERRGGGGIGVMPAGAPGFAKDRQRTPPAEVQQQLLALGRDLRPEATGAADFRQSAEIVAGLDLVVTVDTAMAHLAGSLGVPTWVLLPGVNADWRWLVGRDDSPWYPSVRLLRQASAGDWKGLVETVRRELAAVR